MQEDQHKSFITTRKTTQPSYPVDDGSAERVPTQGAALWSLGYN